MQKLSRRLLVSGSVVFLGIVLGQVQSARAGWTGVMNGTGYGRAGVTVDPYEATAGGQACPFITGPKASMSNPVDSDYGDYGAPLPNGASSATVAKIIGRPGYIWQANTRGSDGDQTAGEGLVDESDASDCAWVVMGTTSETNLVTKTGFLTVNLLGTAGTGVLLSGYECTDNPEPTEEYLETNNCPMLFNVLMHGPFDNNTNNCNAVVIPFSWKTSIENVFFVTKGEARSKPLTVVQPQDIIVDCGEPVTYPEVIEYFGGCGTEATVEFDPPASYRFPIGETTVTATVTDNNGDSASTTFKVVTLSALNYAFGGFYAPINGTGGRCDDPVYDKAKLGSVIPVKFDVYLDGIPYISEPAPIVTVTECGSYEEISTEPAEYYQNKWHGNLDTSRSIFKAGGSYIISVVVEGCTLANVWVGIKE